MGRSEISPQADASIRRGVLPSVDFPALLTERQTESR
jgi:hypothetical protein